jgi:succinate dehydrogenase/fumarate reductase cytochrome b subunit
MENALRFIYAFALSALYDVLFALWVFLWGLSNVYRNTPPSGSEERKWGFGQVMALILLAVPVFVVLDVFYGM